MLTKNDVSGSEGPSSSQFSKALCALTHGVSEPRPEGMKKAALLDIQTYLADLETKRGSLEVLTVQSMFGLF